MVKKKETDLSEKKMNRRTFFAFGAFAAMNAAAFSAWKWLINQPPDGGLLGGIPTPLRPVLDANEKIFTMGYEQGNLAKTYPIESAVKTPRVNGDVGFDIDFDPALWKLEVQKSDGNNLSISLDEIRALPKTEVVFNFKCIEGWSQITYWGGVRLDKFMEHFALKKEMLMNYVGLATPDEAYYVGIDMASALHSQTLLCYEMNGKPLTSEHGYPLRLIIPVKYGVKHLKRIGTMYFDNERPPDYWAQRGYDY